MASNYTPYHNDKAVQLDDLESGNKNLRVTAVPVSSASDRPILGRRHTTNDALRMALKGDKASSLHEEDTLNKLTNVIWKIHNSSIVLRYALYILPVGAVLAIPLVLFAVKYKDTTIDGVLAWKLCVWLETIWVALWVCKLVAKTFPVIWQLTAGLVSAGVRKYAQVLKKLEIPISLLLWTVTAYATCNILTLDSTTTGTGAWVGTLSTVFKASIVVAAILLGEKTIIQLISIDYHRKQYEHKIKQSKKLILLLDMLYDASRRIFPEFSPEFEAEDAEIQGNAMQVRDRLAKVGLHTKFVTGIGRAGDKVTAAFGAMASDITGKQVFSSTSAHAIVVEALESKRSSTALARRLWLSFVSVGNDALYKKDLVEILGTSRAEDAEAIFGILDRDGNGDVSLEEMTALIVTAGIDRKNRAKSMADIGEAIGALDKLMSLIVLVATAIVYAAFFSPSFASSTTQLWSIFTGLAFAIGASVAELISCCLFLFNKHPYDIGDRVEINATEMIVEHISLMYSVFRRIDTDKTVQIPHNIASTLWITNMSRSGAGRERFQFNVSAATPITDIETLRTELMKFVAAPENRRDFKEDIDIHLLSVGDMKALELRVEVKYKSNFIDETLLQSRRNRFMVELLACMRKIPIDPPGGSAPALGDPKNPSYSVAISDVDAVQARDRHAEDVKSKKFVPPVTSPFEAVTSALQSPVNGLLQTMTGRRGSVATRTTRPSYESTLHR